MVQSEKGETEDQSGNHGDGPASTNMEETDSFLPVQADELQHQEIPLKKTTEPQESENYKDYKFTKRILVDLPFRRRFIHSAWLCWAVIGMPAVCCSSVRSVRRPIVMYKGWASGQMGPSFPDLRNIAGQSIETGALIFTVHSFGYVVGSLAEGFLYDRLNTLLTLVVSITVMASMIVVLPWCTNFVLMILVRFLAGVGGGSLEAIANADIASMWDKEGRIYMQALHFSYGVGAILSPLATEPFLSKKTCVPEPDENTTDIYRYHNATERFTVASSVNTSAEPGCKLEYGETQVHYAFLISCCILLTCAIPFLVKYIQTRISGNSLKMKADKTDLKRPDKLPPTLKRTLIVLLCTLLFMYAAVEDSFASFLMTFCIQYLDWSKQQGSLATSLYWLMFATGRFSGIFIVRWFTPGQLILFFIIFLIGSFAGFLIASITMTFAAVWVFVFLIGLSMSIICPCIYSWTEEIILEVSGMISGLFAFSCALGLVVNPPFIGYLIKTLGEISLPYLLLAQCATCLVLYLTIQILVKVFVKHVKRQEIEIEVKVSCSN